jgi:hypothetical protein
MLAAYLALAPESAEVDGWRQWLAQRRERKETR